MSLYSTMMSFKRLFIPAHIIIFTNLFMKALKNLNLKLFLLLILALPEMTSAQVYFTDTGEGDVNAGFRKTGQYQEQYEMMVYLGNISNFMALPPGTQINITNYTHQDLTNMCPDNLGNLQWSVFAGFQPSGGPLTNSAGIFPGYTTWFTVPRANASVQTMPIPRISYTFAADLTDPILGVGAAASEVSALLGNTNVYNNSMVVLEPINLSPGQNLTAFIGDSQNPAFGDFGGEAIDFSVENVTSNNFTTPAVSDFYVDVPNSSGKKIFIDPLTGQATGNDDYLGYFTLNPSGTMTFTKASAVSVPTVGFTSSVTNGFSPLSVVFTNTAAGSITSWVWNFGNGYSITNTTGANVTNTYTTGGDYTVTLTVYGPGGSSTLTVTNLIVASPTPKITETFANSQFVLSGTNCPVGVQYRILNSTNVALPLANWQPVFTNTFLNNGSFAYTNSLTDTAGFFQLVSP
jgi:PKD repeat protein